MDALLTRYQRSDVRGVASTLFSFALHARVQKQWARMVTLEAAGSRAFARADIAVPRNLWRAVSQYRNDAWRALGKSEYSRARQRGNAMSLAEAVEFALGRALTAGEDNLFLR